MLTAIWDGTDFIADAEFWEAEGEEITHWIPALMPLDIPRLEPLTSTEVERIDTNERVLKHLKQKFNRSGE